MQTKLLMDGDHGRAPMSRLTGKTALVTGGSRGIGQATVERFLDEGARVITCGRSKRPAQLSQSVTWFTADIANNDDVEMLRDHITAEFDALSILVNNAGVQIEKTVIESTDSDWDTLMGVNAKGVFLMCRAFIPTMSSGASIINIGSISGKAADPRMALYNASKAFVHGLTRSVAVDHGPEVRCNAICPGWIMTDMAEAAFELANNPKAAKADALARHAAGRFGKPEDVAATAVWLASDDSSFITGQTFIVDGGLVAASPLRPTLF